MYTLDSESLKKFTDVITMLDQIEVKGLVNIQYMYQSRIYLNQILQNIQNHSIKDQPQMQEQPQQHISPITGITGQTGE